MSISQTPSLSNLSTTSITVPSSASFIGGSEDALLMQSVVLISTTDRLRDNIRRNVSAAGVLVENFNTLASRLSNLGKVIKNDWTPVTYDALKASDKDAVSLRSLFAKDGPNLGDSLSQSTNVLAGLVADGISLSAPKRTPVMEEHFTAVDGKIDFSTRPGKASVDWRSDQDLVSINSVTTAGSFAGSFVKTSEVRDAKGSLISATRYTVFIDYPNLRPSKSDLDTAFSGYLQRLSPILSDLESLFSNISKDTDLLDERIRQEMNKSNLDQQDYLTNQQQKFTNLLEINRLLKIYRSEILNMSFLRSQKSPDTITDLLPLQKNENSAELENISLLRPLVDQLYRYSKDQADDVLNSK